MIDDNDFEPMDYVSRIMKAKGYDVHETDEHADIFELQWPAWRDLLTRYRIGDDISRAEQLLTTFMQRELRGGPTRVLESFAAHLDSQPKATGSPDWTAEASRLDSECDACESRGVVSGIPVVTWLNGQRVERVYSFACVCRLADRFPGMRRADDWMIDFARRRTLAERDRLLRWRRERDAEGDTIADFRGGFRLWLERQKLHREHEKKSPARTWQPSGAMAHAHRKLADVRTTPMSEAAKRAAMNAARNGRRALDPPDHLNPDRLALAALTDGDERGEL